MKKKLLSIILSFALVVSLIPGVCITASAETDTKLHVDSSWTSENCGVYTWDSNAFNTVESALEKAKNGDTIILESNIIENILIDKGSEDFNIILDLNGYVIKSVDEPEDGKESVISNKNVLTLKDSNKDSRTNYFVVDENGLWVFFDDTKNTADYTFDSVNGLKKDNKSTEEIPKNGDVIAVSGGCITGAKGAEACGVANTGKFTLESGTIVGNQNTYAEQPLAQPLAGGIQAMGTELAAVDIKGGCIIGNTGITGGVCCGSNFKMTGGIISYNCGKEYGGFNPFICIGQKEFSFGGTARIENNVGTFENLVLLKQDESNFQTINIGTGTDAPKSGMHIGVSIVGIKIEGEESDVTYTPYAEQGKFAIVGTSENAAYFFADDDGLDVAYNNNDTENDLEDDYLELVEKADECTWPCYLVKFLMGITTIVVLKAIIQKTTWTYFVNHMNVCMKYIFPKVKKCKICL